MVKKTVPMASGKGSKIEGCVRSNFKATRSKDLQLHHLPPDILRGILSRLTLKEAVRMSILSRKWKQLWKCYPKLVFTRATMRSSDALIGHQNPLRTRFIRGINSILRQLKSANLYKFVVKFGLRKRHTHHINRWVNFSAASRTKHVVLDLCPGVKGSTDTDDRYSFPLDVFNASGGSCVKYLRLGFVSLTLPSDFCGFKNLKKLSLHKVIITGELQCLLPECSVIEWLSITCCKLVGLSISQQLSRLLFLRVQYCKLQKLNIQAPNLTTFEFADHMIPIVLGESLNISEATIELFSFVDCFDYVFSELVNALSHVQSLSINFRINTEVEGFVKNPSRLTFLRHLVLKIDISGWPETTAGILRLVYLLELAPVLEELVLHMCCFESASYICELSEDALPPCPHSHLKTVRMTGFYGYHGQLELALHILRNATCIERMVIDPVVRNNSFVPSLKSAEVDIVAGRQFARDNLLGRGFGRVLRIL
uniref:F-box domain-containing protein n=1 Tax=Arundo donax TaxID=35708 RepID=A0A0A9CPW2_ARUDO